EKPDTYRASRIKTSKALNPSRFEGSRLLIHGFTDDHTSFFKVYQEGLENLSNRRSLKTLNQNEQVAFWLNLYNVIVINKLVEEYPISKLKSLRSTKRGKKSFWTEKTTTVEGVSLSLTDIEKILFKNFDSPLVAFGLWQGSIGGPRLMNKAFTGNNVWRALENNAVEFVNSNRGLRSPTGSKMKVSDFYEWMMPAFGTSPDHVLNFIKEFANPNFVTGVSGVSTLSFKIYDWTVADILGGNYHSGSSNQLGGLQASHGGRNTSPGSYAEVAALIPNEGDPGAIVGYDATAAFDLILGFTPTGPLEGIPSGAVDLLQGIKANTRLPIPIITTEECAPGENCLLVNPEENEE
ncbi:MAG: DUF547 domain-containing protein, partial [Sphingomonadales bacterium]